MKLYFLVEGKRTESIVYPRWLSILLPEYERIYDPFLFLDREFTGNYYYLFDGGGYPNMLKDMVAAARDINEIGAFDYFVICLDTDDDSCAERERAVCEYFEQSGIELTSELVVITQRVCIESWFLGNRELLKRPLRGEDIRRFVDFYDISHYDPQEMGKPRWYRHSKAMFHFRYFELLTRKNSHKYSKGRPYFVCSKEYLNELIERAYITGHIGSFRKFIDFCKKLRNR